GNMVHNVHAIEVVLSGGDAMRFGPPAKDADGAAGDAAYRALTERLRGLYAREAEEIAARFPKLLRRVAAYNLDLLAPTSDGGAPNFAQLLVGSEGTLGYFTEIELDLKPLPRHKVLGVCHFPKFYGAMDSTRHIVALSPTAVELVDRTMIELARAIPIYERIVAQFLRGEPDALLLVEFAGDDRETLVGKLRQLGELISDLGFPGSVVEITDGALQRDTWEVRKAGLNIMMSMKGDGKPVSFIEDCAVPLEDLAEYTDRLTRVFEKHGTRGTWYAHASVGCLHVRPILNMKEDGATKMRAIAEEAAALVREYKGSYSGEHGDGLVRSEWIEPMYGARLMRAFEEVKDAFDPLHLMNPGKIVRAPRMDDRSLFRFPPGYQIGRVAAALDWSEAGGFGAAVEMCNNNGECRKFDAEVMCPSYRVTRDERHLTRGRANTLRLALSGQLGAGAFTSDAMAATMELCVSCKGCKRECPTGVDMAKMKIEFLHHYGQHHGWTLKDRLIAYLPRYAPRLSRWPALANLRDRLPGLARLSERTLGLSARRTLPTWRRDAFSARGREAPPPTVSGREVVLLADTFNTYFEPENLTAALAVLTTAGYAVHVLQAPDGGRPLCCGRTFLAVGLIDEARVEARRTLAALRPFVERSVPVIGLEPSCLLTLRDEFLSLLPGAPAAALAQVAVLFEEFLAAQHAAGDLDLPLKPLAATKALVHGHCHQKAFGLMGAVYSVLRLVPNLEVEPIASSCCGMAGAFGYEARHFDVSMQMAELSLLPTVRAAEAATMIVADGTSCRHQIRDGAGREARHVARVLQEALAARPEALASH
ncbi:MAG: FAD-binding and (Fe-S)-binding domain-containing protein, partial [Casimicrobiaceae bacterium]